MKKSTIWGLIIVLGIIIVILILVPSKGPVPVFDEPEQVPSLPSENIESFEEIVLSEQQEEVPAPLAEDTDSKEKPEQVVEQEAASNIFQGGLSAPEELMGVRAINESEIVQGAIRIKASNTGFSPKEFSVESGKIITLGLTSVDRTHVFAFEDPGLQNAAVGLGPEETRQTTFKAPAPGDYVFFCDVPGHRGRGESGVMHVR